MIPVENLLNTLKKNKISFFTGVPDSILKNLSILLDSYSSKYHKMAVNEGSAVAIGIGHYLATKKIFTDRIAMVKQRRLCNLILCLISSRTIAFRSSRSLTNRSPARKSRLSLLRKQPFGADRWHSLPTALFAEDEYARGEDIWPPSGDDAVKLEDSFPKEI